MNSYLIIYTLNALYEFPMRLYRNTGPPVIDKATTEELFYANATEATGRGFQSISESF